MKIILASNSPRRKELLSLICNNFEVIVSNEEEIIEEKLTLEEQVKHIAYIKAKSVFDKTTGDRIVIGSDTIVTKNGKIYGKPKDYNNAKEILNDLKNSKHEVITAVTVLIEENGIYKEYIDYDVTSVYISDMSDKEIEKWISKGELWDKAGAYAIQTSFCAHIDKIEGDYTTVTGLPVRKVYNLLKEYVI